MWPIQLLFWYQFLQNMAKATKLNQPMRSISYTTARKRRKWMPNKLKLFSDPLVVQSTLADRYLHRRRVKTAIIKKPIHRRTWN